MGEGFRCRRLRLGVKRGTSHFVFADLFDAED